MVTVQLDKSTWRALQALKEPGDSFDDVVSELVQAHDYDHSEANADD